jgi:hypothetical protein
MVANEELADKEDTKFKLKDYVMLDLRKTAMSKSYDVQRYQVFFISNILNSKRPIMYTLKDTKHLKTVGNYYASQIRKSPVDPSSAEHWVVQKVVGQKVVNKKTFFKVRYLNYPASYDEYLERSKIPSDIYYRWLKMKKLKRLKRAEKTGRLQ